MEPLSFGLWNQKTQNLGNAVFLTPKAEGIGVKTQLFFAYHLTSAIHKLQVILPAYITYIQMRNAILGKDSVHKTGKGVKLKINQTYKKINVNTAPAWKMLAAPMEKGEGGMGATGKSGHKFLALRGQKFHILLFLGYHSITVAFSVRHIHRMKSRPFTSRELRPKTAVQ